MLTDDEVMAEVLKIQYFYGLKKEIRYGEMRTDVGESVAEHIYGMHILALYFLELEDAACTWDRARIYEMITWHDMDELETGDVIGYKKTEADKEREATAIQSVIGRTPNTIKIRFVSILDEYQKQASVESRFVKGLDKIEPLFQVYNKNGKEILLRNKTTLDDSRRIKDRYVEAFPHMKHFNDVLNRTMDKEGFFTHLS
jgi:5'-deoxynucleotidase YfbR-like HD superfamily hydrolase